MKILLEGPPPSGWSKAALAISDSLRIISLQLYRRNLNFMLCDLMPGSKRSIRVRQVCVALMARGFAVLQRHAARRAGRGVR
jgi:hypothetical protein